MTLSPVPFSRFTVRVGVSFHGRRKENAVWAYVKAGEEDGIRLVSDMACVTQKEHFAQTVGPALLPFTHLIKPTDVRDKENWDEAPTGQYLYAEADFDYSEHLALAMFFVSHKLNEETVLALASGLVDFVEVDVNEEMLIVAKAEPKKEYKTSTSTSAEMTVASDSFKITIGKNGGEMTIQMREHQTQSFQLARIKLDEFIAVLTDIRDRHIPAIDKFGEE